MVATASGNDARPLDRIVADPALLGRLGRLEVRLAASAAEVRDAQALRYRIFHEARRARTTVEDDDPRHDEDRFDAHCDHLLLLDPTRGQTTASRLIGTYRLLGQDAAYRAGGFYGEAEFAVADLVARHPGRRFLELGRSCVLPDYRGRRTMELLWHGIWAYVVSRRFDVLFGCASLPGTAVEALTPALAFLRRNARAPAPWQAEAAGNLGRPLPSGGASDRTTLASLPPLIKGYLRLGGMVSDSCVVDDVFGTTDVFLVLPVERISKRYVDHYGTGAQRFA